MAVVDASGECLQGHVQPVDLLLVDQAPAALRVVVDDDVVGAHRCRPSVPRHSGTCVERQLQVGALTDEVERLLGECAVPVFAGLPVQDGQAAVGVLVDAVDGAAQ